MSLTAFQRFRRMQQVEEMKPENIVAKEEVKENFTDAPLVPDEQEVKEDTLVPEATEEKENKTTARRNTKKK